MFTGIIQEIGSIVDIKTVGGGLELTVLGRVSATELDVSDSVSINGVCQTVLWKEGDRFSVVAVEETLSKTTFGSLTISSRVNLELPLKMNDRLGGHIVLGHVDTVGRVGSSSRRETSWLFDIMVPSTFRRYLIPVGSIAVDGVSLTVAAVRGDSAVVSIIPHTMEHTVFSFYKVGTLVNLEFDIIGKYVERLMESGIRGKEADSLSDEQLKQWGYEA